MTTTGLARGPLLRSFIAAVQLYGPFAALRLVVRRWRGTPGVHLTLHRWPHRRLYVRLGNSDLAVAQQVFLARQYDLGPGLTDVLRDECRRIRRAGEVPVIVDAGANVGYSAVYFAELLPESLVVAIEPAADSFATLMTNIAGLANIDARNAALWTDDQGVTLVRGEFGSWSDQVSAGAQGDPVSSVSLEQLVASVPRGRLVILKMDIEGAERAVCAASRGVLGTAPCLIIEPHDWMEPGGGCLGPILETMASRSVDVLVKGENLVFIESALHAKTVARKGD